MPTKETKKALTTSTIPFPLVVDFFAFSTAASVTVLESDFLGRGGLSETGFLGSGGLLETVLFSGIFGQWQRGASGVVTE